VRLWPITLALLIACGSPREEPREPITVFAAASLARPLKTLADSFTQRSKVDVLSELGGSLEHSRKITELGRIPDVLMLVDDDVVAALVPTHLEWYVRFATNRVVIAYATRSKFADSITSDNWWRVLARPDVRVGRADPGTAPAGRHALALLDRVDTYYNRRGLSDSILARSPLRFIRPNATELAALLETGEVDYILDYESVARQYGFRFVTLPEELAPAILYGLSVPRQAAHPTDAVRFAAFALSDAGKHILRNAHVDVLQTPVAVGPNVPPEIAALVRTTAHTSAGR
jgi:molybdate/tungstate transport system substrate-binding protein